MYAAASMALQTVRTTNALAIIPSASGAEMPAASWDGSAPQAEVQVGDVTKHTRTTYWGRKEVCAGDATTTCDAAAVEDDTTACYDVRYVRRVEASSTLSHASTSSCETGTEPELRKRTSCDAGKPPSLRGGGKKRARSSAAAEEEGGLALAAESTPPSLSIESLSDDLLHKIVSHLDPVGVSSLRSTCRRFRDVFGCDAVWRSALTNLVGEACTSSVAAAHGCDVAASHGCPRRAGQSIHGKHAGGSNNQPRDGPSMGELARKVVTLEGLRWRSRRVGGQVSPSRCNYSACATASGSPASGSSSQAIVLFGGDHCQNALNDTHVLDLNESQPAWKPLYTRNNPPGRFGHTLRSLGPASTPPTTHASHASSSGSGGGGGFGFGAGSTSATEGGTSGPFSPSLLSSPASCGQKVVLFGGCGSEGLYNDLFVLDLSAPYPTWTQVHALCPPDARVWHAACIVQGRTLVVFGGCDKVGELMNDTHVLDLGALADGAIDCADPAAMAAYQPTWRRVNALNRPPARIGHSLAAMASETGRSVVLFGGIANLGPVRARDNTTFKIDLDEVSPVWRTLHHAAHNAPQTNALTQGHQPATPSAGQPRASHAGSAAGGAGGVEAHASHAKGSSEGSAPPLAGASVGGTDAPAPAAAGACAGGEAMPAPRLDHVCWRLPDDRLCVFGGSPSVFGEPNVVFSESMPEMFLLDARKGTAQWRKITIEGKGPQCAWTHSACILDFGTKCVLLGGDRGQDWLVNELYELDIFFNAS